MNRQKVKGTIARRFVMEDTEPNFSKVPFIHDTKKIFSRRCSRSIRIRAPQVDNAESSTDPPTPTLSEEESSEEGEIDVLFFEGKPFHYLDRSDVVPNCLLVDEARL